MSINTCNYTNYKGWKPLNGTLGLRMAVWSQVNVCGSRFSLRPIGCTSALSVTQKRHRSCSMWLVTLCKCRTHLPYMPYQPLKDVPKATGHKTTHIELGTDELRLLAEYRSHGVEVPVSQLGEQFLGRIENYLLRLGHVGSDRRSARSRRRV